MIEEQEIGSEPIAKITSNHTADFRAGYCAIVGVPNAGKSTLLNALLGTKLSIISHKPQTTRKRVLGIFSTPREQIVFLDTPGIMPNPSSMLHRTMLDQVKRSFDDADVILVLAESNKSPERALPETWEAYKRLAGNKPIVLAVSKMDLKSRPADLLPVLQQYGEMPEFGDILPLSAKKKKNLEELVRVLHKYLPSETPFYDDEQLSDLNERFFVSELIRETIYHKYGDEIPYSADVNVREFNEREAGKWFISADIIVERDSQKAILIGKDGEALKEVGTRTRKEIESFLDHPVFLELHVKTKKDWRNDKNALADLGYTVS